MNAQRMDIDFARPLFKQAERDAVARVLSQHWLASGAENEAFEREFAAYVGTKYALCVNSGSSANLLALAALDLPQPSRVVTSGCGFPATLSPVLHLWHDPVLVDYDIATHNVDVSQVVDAMKDARAVILAHTMGIPVDLAPIMAEAERRGVVVIEDCCEAIGARYAGKQVGSIGHVGTFSFYPSHQITAGGGGGMLVTSDERIYRRAKSLRDWGKSSNWDTYGRNNTTYTATVDGIQYFPHYVYETCGYNMKLPEMNAAFGRVQLTRVDRIVETRRANHDFLVDRVPSGMCEQIHVPAGADPSWFGVILTLKNGSRDRFGDYLEHHGVRHRPFFAGNITRHEPFAGLRRALPVADRLMRDSLFVGCYAGLESKELEYMSEVIRCGLSEAQPRPENSAAKPSRAPSVRRVA